MQRPPITHSRRKACRICRKALACPNTRLPTSLNQGKLGMQIVNRYAAVNQWIKDGGGQELRVTYSLISTNEKVRPEEYGASKISGKVSKK